MHPVLGWGKRLVAASKRGGSQSREHLPPARGQIWREGEASAALRGPGKAGQGCGWVFALQGTHGLRLMLRGKAPGSPARAEPRVMLLSPAQRLAASSSS